MRIYLDARNITEQPAGVAHYAMALIPELVRQAPEHNFVVIRHASNRRPLPIEAAVDGAITEVFVDRPIDTSANFLLGARTLSEVFAAHGAPDLYHDLFHILPRGLPGSLPVVVTLHDLVWIDHARLSQPNSWTAATMRLFAQVAIPYALGRADRVISVSRPTAERAAEWIAPERSVVIPHGVHARFFDPPPEPEAQAGEGEGSKRRPAIVAIGNDKPYKNLQTLIRAFALAKPELGDAQLVLIGRCDGLVDTIRGVRLIDGDDVVRTGFLDDSTLRQVLGAARLFVFPSLVEGFGLPVLEAMAMGVPTAVSDREPMRTVGGDAALRFEATDPVALAEVLTRVVADDALYGALSQAGREHAAQFTWAESARRTLEVYEELG